ncbi:MAG: hypothetical protein OXM61_18510 [Candidatus Poribacteria bacterium]|nr:hypothetical protein [Candidatus Poribacteria bacterium]
MNTLFEKTKAVSIFCLILLILVSILSGMFWIYYTMQSEKWAALIGGIISGLVAVIVTLCLSYYEFKKIERFKRLGIKDVLPERTDKKYYEQIIRNAKTLIQVMGTSCTRFLDDFGDQSRPEHALVDTLNSKSSLKVQILVPNESNMDITSKARFESDSIKRVINELTEKYSDRFIIKRFNFPPTHSLVRADNHLIVGPVFPKVDSRHTPAIHLKTSSEYAKKYIQYFDDVWTASDG